MTDYQDDDWELDINFGMGSLSHPHSSVLQRKGVYSTESDKEHATVHERYKYPYYQSYLEDDDTNSSVTSGSVLSSRLSEIDLALNDLDEYMLDEPHSSRRSSSLLWTPITMNQNSGNYPGVVKKVTVPPTYQELQDNDDWTDDIDIPTKGMAALKATPKCYDQTVNFMDDLHDLDDFDNAVKNDAKIAISSRHTEERSVKTNHDTITSSLPISGPKIHFRYEPEQDNDDDMSGLDFPDNMAILPKRLDEKKKYPHSSTITKQPSKAALTTRIPVSTAMKSKSKFLTSVERERDDDDFCEGLNIREKAFTFSSSPPPPRNSSQKSSNSPIISRTSHLQQPRIREREPTSFVSRLARPSPLLNNNGKQASHILSLAKRSNLPQSTFENKLKLTSPTSRPTYSSDRLTARQSNSNTLRIGTQNNSSTQYLTMKKSLLRKPNASTPSYLTDHQPSERKCATGYTLIARPKTKETTYCSRLDNIDNLNDLRPKPNRKGYTQNPKFELSKSNSGQQWPRSNQRDVSRPDRSKIKLIQPNQQRLKKAYNDMIYDDSNFCWKGNETSLVGFQDKPVHRRPMLIMNKQQKNAPSRYAAVVGSSMIFNTESQKWVSANGQGGECNELDTIEDLKDELFNCSSSKDNTSHPSLEINPVESKSNDFKLTISSKRRMMAEQEQHESWIANWPIKTNSF